MLSFKQGKVYDSTTGGYYIVQNSRKNSIVSEYTSCLLSQSSCLWPRVRWLIFTYTQKWWPGTTNILTKITDAKIMNSHNSNKFTFSEYLLSAYKLCGIISSGPPKRLMSTFVLSHRAEDIGHRESPNFTVTEYNWWNQDKIQVWKISRFMLLNQYGILHGSFIINSLKYSNVP